MSTTLKQFIAASKVRMSVDYADTNPNFDADGEWMRQARHFKCVLRVGSRQMTVPFSQGCAISREPTAADVLDCLASDASGFENARSFDDWCAEYGYDTDSRRAEKIYQTIERQAAQLSKLLGPEDYKTLLWETERL